MFCENCGHSMSDNAKFCGKCGYKVQEPELKCPFCGAESEPDMIFCEQCGTRLQGAKEAASKTEQAATNIKASANAYAGAASDASRYTVSDSAPGYEAPVTPANNMIMIAESPTVTWYKGNKSLGTSSINGKLKLYADRIEFVTTFSASPFGSKPPSCFMFSNITTLDKGRYMMGSSILVCTKTGEMHTFAALSAQLYNFLDQAKKQMK